MSIRVVSAHGTYDLWIGEICFLRLSFVYDRTQDGVIGGELCLCTELARLGIKLDTLFSIQLNQRQLSKSIKHV